MNKLLAPLVMIFGLAMMVIPSLIFLEYSETQTIGKQLCVDGQNNINLEGIMCEETETTLFGYTEYSFGGIIFFIIAILFLMTGIMVATYGFVGLSNE